MMKKLSSQTNAFPLGRSRASSAALPVLLTVLDTAYFFL